MKTYQPKLPALVTGVILSGLLGVPPAHADTATPGSAQAKEITKDAESAAKNAAEEKMAKYSKEAVDAIKAVDEAITLLDKGKKDEAIKKLEIASGKLEIAMAAEPSLELVPLATDVFTYDLITSPKQVKADLDAVDDLIDDGDVQTARELLNRLHSEIVTETTFLPVATYPDAIKRAVKEINANQSKKARETLLVAMDSLIEEAVVTPLPIVLAHGAIKGAEQAQKTEKDKALRDLDYAAEQIETAKALGYFFDDKAEYKEINKTIKNLRHAVKGKSKTEKLFDDAKNTTKKLLDKFKHKNRKMSVNKAKQ